MADPFTKAQIEAVAEAIAKLDNWNDYNLVAQVALTAAAKAGENAAGVLREALKRLCRAYVNLIEAGRDRIIDLGGQCDPLDVMEASDPHLRAARAALAAAPKAPSGDGVAPAINIVIVHFAQGETAPGYHAIGDGGRLFIVDDNCPNDRVFEYTRRAPASVFAELIPAGTEIGSPQDARHEACANRIKAALDGRKPFSIIEPEEPETL